jgi:hypothetical protein
MPGVAAEPKAGLGDVKQTKSNLRAIGTAMFNIDRKSGLPTPAICDKDGKALLSWRVAILPFMETDKDECAKLYKEFKLDEAWDSENNKKLLERMPKMYGSPGIELKDNSLTYYKIFVGKDAVFDEGRRLHMGDLPAGTAFTIMAVEAGDAVAWTKPDEGIPFDAKKPLPKLVGPYEGILNVLAADGHAYTLPADFDEKKLRKAVNKDLGYDNLQREGR